MSDTPDHYQCLRSHGDVHLFVVCYADKFYAEVPYTCAARDRGMGPAAATWSS